MDPTKLAKLSPKEELDILNRALLHIYHRNKNQHHRSHWWKHLNTFRRQLRLISTEILSEKTKTADSSEARVTFQSKGQKRVKAWAEFFVVQWYRAFGQILAERRFASIGLVLIAILARASALLGATRALLELGHRQIVKEMENLQTDSDVKQIFSTIEKTLAAQDEDLGEIVERELKANVSGLQVTTTESVEERTIARSDLDPSDTEKPSSTKIKKKKKSSNAIDDLFESLG